jgi:hypothetical protein
VAFRTAMHTWIACSHASFMGRMSLIRAGFYHQKILISRQDITISNPVFRWELSSWTSTLPSENGLEYTAGLVRALSNPQHVGGPGTRMRGYPRVREEGGEQERGLTAPYLQEPMRGQMPGGGVYCTLTGGVAGPLGQH